MKYEIFAGLSDELGGVNSMGIHEFDSPEEAMAFAYDKACDIYDKKAGTSGIADFETILLELKSEEDNKGMIEDELEAIAWEIYDDERDDSVIYNGVEIQE